MEVIHLSGTSYGCLWWALMMWLTSINASGLGLYTYLPSGKAGTWNSSLYVFLRMQNICKMFSLWFSACKPLNRRVHRKPERSMCRLHARLSTEVSQPGGLLWSCWHPDKLICVCLLCPGLSTPSCCQPHWATAMLPWLHGRGQPLQLQEVRGGARFEVRGVVPVWCLYWYIIDGYAMNEVVRPSILQAGVVLSTNCCILSLNFVPDSSDLSATTDQHTQNSMRRYTKYYRNDIRRACYASDNNNNSWLCNVTEKATCRRGCCSLLSTSSSHSYHEQPWFQKSLGHCIKPK